MSILQEKKVIIIGDRDGISARTIEECVKNEPTAQVVYSVTEFFFTVMDLDSQMRIKKLSEKYGTDDMVVIIGTGDKETTRLAAHTMTSLKLKVFHALEDSFMNAVGNESWEEHLKIYETLIDTESTLKVLHEIRA